QYYNLTAAAFLHWYTIEYALKGGDNDPSRYPPGIETFEMHSVDPFLYPEIIGLHIALKYNERTAQIYLQNVALFLGHVASNTRFAAKTVKILGNTSIHCVKVVAATVTTMLN